jgi:RNA polymerase sigma-70 factor, ECF subfamily
MVGTSSLPIQFAPNLPEYSTDAQLVAECKRGNLRAYESLYAQHAPRMKSLALRLLGSRADAEDAVQEAFLKVYRAMAGFDGNSAIATWMYRILINCCYDSLRRKQHDAEAPVTREPSIDSKVTLKIALERALDRINERPRLVFLLFEVEGLKHSEIAAILQVPEGTSRNWLFEAKRDLKKILTETSQ